MAAATSAVYVKDAYKHYGPKSGPKRKQVLDGLCMKVHRGSIYGLLGASGCGKTTLLSCIVGRRLLDSGELWVLGGTPGTEGSGVPGPRIGYMPQETALVPEFTVKGIIFYFGRIFGMDEKVIEERFKELSLLLDLPPDNRCVEDCSGGQQRRISFAATLIHDPELLILDEPTVGLDPVLRERIWEYLVEITNKKNIAVIITTHYIEECKQAHTIGLMRQGRLLAEEPPNDLIQRYGAETLEEVFLDLSRKQAAGLLPPQNVNHEYDQLAIESTPNGNQSVASSVVSLEQGNGSLDLLTGKLNKGQKKLSSWSINWERFKALYFKNWYTFFHNRSGVMFAVLFPIIQMTVFFLAVGGDPKGLSVAFVNKENGSCENFDSENYVYFTNESECEYRNLGCKFLEQVEDPMIKKFYVDDLGSAIDALNRGKYYAVVYLAQNYTESTRERTIDGKDASDDALEFGEIKVWIDKTNHQLSTRLQYRLFRKYVDFQKIILGDCNYNPKLGDIPLRIGDPVYGSEKDSFTVFMIPGFLITVIFFMATMMTSTVFITERLDGVWDRTLVAGATTAEILVSHLATQFTIITFQAFELLVITFLAFRVEVVGLMIDFIVILLVMGVSGMCYGFLISVICESHTQANFISTGSFYPMLIISGVMWPVEAMPIVLKLISYVFPFTMPIEALRSVMKKGWAITDMLIVDAYGVTIAWTVIYLLLSFYLLKTKM